MNDKENNENDELSEQDRRDLLEFHQEFRPIMQELKLHMRHLDELATHPDPTPMPAPAEPSIPSTAPKLSNPPTQEEREAYRKWAAL